MVGSATSGSSRGPFGSSSASSMSTGSPHSPLSDAGGHVKRDSLEKPPLSHEDLVIASNGAPSSRDFRRVFSIRLPFDLFFDRGGFSRHQSATNKFNVIYLFIT